MSQSDSIFQKLYKNVDGQTCIPKLVMKDQQNLE